MNKRKFMEILKNMNKKTVIIAAVAVVVLAVILIVIFISDNGADGYAETDTSGSDTVQPIDTEISGTDTESSVTDIEGDPADDPENNDIIPEEGANVDAGELSAEVGRSNGIDVSKWQGKIDWQMVKSEGIDFAFIRIGYRGENGVIYKDDNADYNIQKAEDAGVLVGVYFFSTAVNETEAREEAEWTTQAIEGYGISYPVVYDCEGYKLPSSRMYSLTATERSANALAFLNSVSEAGYDAMLYGARNELIDPLYWDLSQIESDYKIWVAQYPTVTYPAKDMPDYSGRCDAWQYTNNGSVVGISGNVDMVVCYFTKEKAEPKNMAAVPDEAKTPLGEEDRRYTTVNETVTAKELTNLRAAATTKSDIVKTLKNGETAVRIGIGDNGWSKIEYNGQIVYAITSYLTTDLSAETIINETEGASEQDIVSGNVFEPQNDSVTAKYEVNLRLLPSTDSDIVGTLKSGNFLMRTAVSNKGWSRLDYNGQVVYAVTSYLTNEVITQETEPPVTESDGFDPVDEQVTAKIETNLRTVPSTKNSEVVYTLKNGEYIRRIGINTTSGWSKLEYNGQTVYAVSNYLTGFAESE